MAYIGTKPTIGNFQICDAISVVNGQAAYTMQVGSVNVIPQSANHMIVSLNGTIQKPNSSFTVSGSTITFASNLATGDAIDFIQILGDVLDLGVPSDSTCTTAKIVDDAVTAAKINDDIISGATELASEPADTDEFLVSDAGTLKRIDYSLIKGGGKVLQAVSGTDNTQRSASSSNYSHGNSTAIATLTPSATSSKVLVIATTAVGKAGGSAAFSIFRDNSTNLATNQMLWHDMAANTGGADFSGVFLDSPNTTSEINYRIKWTNNTSNATYISYNNSLTSVIAIEIGA